jgi:hypothetical protein
MLSHICVIVIIYNENDNNNKNKLCYMLYSLCNFPYSSVAKRRYRVVAFLLDREISRLLRPAILTYEFRAFPQTLRANAGWHLKLGHGRFSQHLFQFVINYSYYNLALYNL